MSTQTLEINKNSYVAFDATSLRDLIITRLNKNSVFTDQNYIGSNISEINEIISCSFSTLMFYLNKTSTESMYTEAQLYENMNRIVKLLDYKPLGYQTASVGFNLVVQNLSIGNYIIPRYSYITVGDTAFSFNTDVSFTKTVNTASELIDSISNNYRIYQGRYFEYPLYTATGSTNELVAMSIDTAIKVDHFNIDVYVQDYKTNFWSQWTRVDSLFSHSSRDLVFEIRLNENKRYEIKFGDNINGKKLNLSDKVSIYYISSSGSNGEIGASALQGTMVSKYNSPNYNNILSDTLLNYTYCLKDSEYKSLVLNNEYESTTFAEFEDVESIRNKASKNYKTQGRLITEQDYTTYIKSNFSNFISDVVVKNNNDYLTGYIKYLTDIGINSPQLESRVMFNQVNFANSCNFNNIYAFVLPATNNKSYLMPSQKSAIIEAVSSIKSLTSDLIVSDPVYVAVDIAAKNTNAVSLDDINNTETYIETTKFNRRSNDSIKSDIKTILSNYFSKTNLKLGSVINLYQIYSDILNIDGINRLYSKRIDTNIIVEGLSLIIWNPIYPETDVYITTQNISLPFFKCAYLNNLNEMINKIKFTGSTGTLQSISA